MVERAERKRVLITVRTYPTPARKGVEVSCTAGVTDDGEWIRLYPIPSRSARAELQFTKYQWIDVEVRKARNDARPESYTPNLDSIQVGRHVLSSNSWERRKEVIFPLRAHCLCCLEEQREAHGIPTLGFFRPFVIRRLTIEPDDANWTAEQLAKLRQYSLFDSPPARELEKIPFRFKYVFECDHSTCSGHTMMCTDWELGESFRKWKGLYGRDWEPKFRHRYEYEMIELNDTHFYVGTLHGHPGTWIIVGLFYPRRMTTASLEL